jgi:hypothetical protein
MGDVALSEERSSAEPGSLTPAQLFRSDSLEEGSPRHANPYLQHPQPAWSATEAFGINDTGQIVGQYSDLGGTHGFLLSGRTYTTLDDPLAIGGDTFAFGMNNTGQIVGSYTNATGTHGFVLSGGIDYTTLDDPVAAFGNTIARGINTTGMIVGYYKWSAPRGVYRGRT